MAWIPPPLKSEFKRPVSHEALAAHLKRWETLKAEKILDVGFGRECRSTMALRQVFPRAQIDSIDNDLDLVNNLPSPATTDDGKTRYLFGDADFWLPSSKDYDLIVVCHAAHAFHHPLRAIENLVEQNLKDGRHILVVHRTDAVMRATNLLLEESADNEVGAILKLWEKIKEAWKTHRPGAPFSLRWQDRFVSEHPLVKDRCESLGLTAVENEHTTEHPREIKENLSDIFGSRQSQPRYQAPAHVWLQLSANWPENYADFVINARVRITSYLYKKTGGTATRHSLGFPLSTGASEILRFTLHPSENHRDSSGVRSFIGHSLGRLSRDVRTVYFTDKDGTAPICGNKLPPLAGMEENTFTTAIINSQDVWRERSGEYDFRLFLLPALSKPEVYEPSWVMPPNAAKILGLHANEVFLIPLSDDTCALKGVLANHHFSENEYDRLADYLMKRGKWMLSKEVECSVIYYFVFRSTLLDPQNNCQAISFLAKRWLEPDAVRELTNIANAYLQALLEKKTQEMSWEHQKAASGRDNAKHEITTLRNRIEDAARLENVVAGIPGAHFDQSDSALAQAASKLDTGVKKLMARLIVAAWQLKGDRVSALEYIYGRSFTGYKVGRFLTRNFGSQNTKVSCNAASVADAARNVLKLADKDLDESAFERFINPRVAGKVSPQAPAPPPPGHTTSTKSASRNAAAKATAIPCKAAATSATTKGWSANEAVEGMKKRKDLFLPSE